MRTGDLLVAMSVRFIDVEFVTANVRPTRTEQIQATGLLMTVREFQHRFADSLVLLTWQGQGALEFGMSALKPA